MRRGILITAFLAVCGAAWAFDASPLLQYVTAGGAAWTPASLSPVSWWKFDGNALDSVSTNNGTVLGPTLATGVNGQCYNFGTTATNRIVVTGIATGTNYTIAAWVKQSVYSTVNCNILDSLAGRALVSFSSPSGAFGYLSTYLGSFYVFGPMPTNTWHHLIYIVNGDGKYASAYVDGVQSSTNMPTSAVTKLGGVASIGNRYDGAGNLIFKGLIDDVIVINRVLTPSEIAQLYNWRQ